MSDDVTSIRAAMDQLCEVRKEQAREVAAYYHALRGQGVPRLLAAALVRDWHGWKCAPEDEA